MKRMIAAAVAVLSVASQAHADNLQSIPPSDYLYTITEFGRGNGAPFFTTTGTSATFTDGNFYGGYITTGYPANVFSSITELRPTSPAQMLYSWLYIKYSFLITAPSVAAADAFQSAHPTLTVDGSATLQTSGGGNTQIEIDQPGATLDFYSCSTGNTTQCGTFDFSSPVYYRRLNGTEFGESIALNVTSISTGIGAASGLVDGLLSLNGDFVAQNPGFTFVNLTVASPVVQAPPPPPTASVPEPSTWAMMILGVAAIGAAFRRRALPLAA